MNDRDHRDEGEHDWYTTESISEDEDRNSREKGTKYGDKATDKNDERKRDNKWKCSTMENTNHYQSDAREYGIDERDDRLRSEDESKTCTDFLCDNCPFIIEKLEITIPDLSQEFFDTNPLDEKEVGEEEC